MKLNKTEIKPLKKILIVEDEKLIGWSVTKLLQKSGYHVFITESPEKAIELLNSLEFHLVLTDLNLPLSNGQRFAEIIKQKDPAIPVILMSSSNLTKEEKIEYKGKVDEIIEKPIDFDELISLINQLIK